MNGTCTWRIRGMEWAIFIMKNLLKKNVLFEFDDYECIPIYMEIEAPSSEIINEYLSKLNIPLERVKAWGFEELFAYYNR